MTWKNFVSLAAALLVALAGWAASLQEPIQNWASLVEPKYAFALAGILGGVLLAWIGDSPLGRRNGS